MLFPRTAMKETLLNVSSLGTINPAEVWQALRKSPQAFKGLVKLAQDPEALKAVLQSVPDLWKVAGDHFEVMQQALAHNLDLLGTALFGDSERIALAGAGDFRVFMSKGGEDGSQILRMVGDDGGTIGGIGDIPQGLTLEEWNKAASILRERVGAISNEIFVQGSRASGIARIDSDIDFGIRVTKAKFDELIERAFGMPNPGSAKERTMLRAIASGKIQAGEAGLRTLRVELERVLGKEVDISIILAGGPFDTGPLIYLP